jgi:class 3 adenylate cyclase
MDIKDFTEKHKDAKIQVEMIKKLNKFVTEWFKKEDISEDSYLINTTGDGMVVGFDNDQELPLKLAIYLQKRIKKYATSKNRTKFGLKIGIDGGPVYAIKNIRNETDYIGPGINSAQRVMSFGRAGHILVSHETAEKLTKLSHEYKKIIHELKKTYEIREGERIKIDNVYDAKNTFGNRLYPKQITLKK